MSPISLSPSPVAAIPSGLPTSPRAGRGMANLRCGLPPEEAEEFYSHGFLMEAVPVHDSRRRPHVDNHRDVQPARLHAPVRREHPPGDRRALRADLRRQRLVGRDRRVPEIVADAKVIRNAENRGFPAAVNQGIAVANGDQVLLLNNDTIVTTGWLRRMLAALYSDPKIGLVGPCSNFVGSEQQIEVGYESPDRARRLCLGVG